MPKPIDAILNAAADKAKSSRMVEESIRMGSVSAVATDGTITVTAAGSTFPKVRLLASTQVPVVGDSVEIANTLGGWVCLGVLRTSKAPRVQSGSLTMTSTTANEWSAYVTVTFPIAFASAPIVVAMAQSGGPTVSAEMELKCTGVTSTSFQISQRRGSTSPGVVGWIATDF